MLRFAACECSYLSPPFVLGSGGSVGRHRSRPWQLLIATKQPIGRCPEGDGTRKPRPGAGLLAVGCGIQPCCDALFVWPSSAGTGSAPGQGDALQSTAQFAAEAEGGTGAEQGQGAGDGLFLLKAILHGVNCSISVIVIVYYDC